MRRDEIGKAGIAGPDLDHGEEDQERDAGDDFRHHQRLIDEGVDEIEAAIGFGTGRRQRRHGGGDRRDDGGESSNDEGARRGLDDLGIIPGGDVPAPGEALPDGNGWTGIEGIDDQRCDRDIEQDEAEECYGAEAGLPLDGEIADPLFLRIGLSENRTHFSGRCFSHGGPPSGWHSGHRP